LISSVPLLSAALAQPITRLFVCSSYLYIIIRTVIIAALIPTKIASLFKTMRKVSLGRKNNAMKAIRRIAPICIEVTPESFCMTYT
jgi:hypothetical protein